MFKLLKILDRVYPLADVRHEIPSEHPALAGGGHRITASGMNENTGSSYAFEISGLNRQATEEASEDITHPGCPHARIAPITQRDTVRS